MITIEKPVVTSEKNRHTFANNAERVKKLILIFVKP